MTDAPGSRCTTSGKMRKLVLVAASLVVVCAACGGSNPAASTSPMAKSTSSPATATEASMTFQGIKRGYLLWRPAALTLSKPVPLVIAMHGCTSEAGEMEYMSNFDQVATEDRFVVVYPEGLGRSWNAGWCCGHNTNDDVGFISALIDKVAPEQNIDRTRILATGMSNGAMLSQRLGCELAAKITAVVSVSGSLLLDTCHPSRPISVMEFHGDADDLVPLNGGFTAGIGTFRPTMSVVQQWTATDGCPAKPAAADDATSTTYTWSPCEAGTKVVLEVVKGGAHSWFGPQDTPGEPDASRLAWRFLMDAPPLN